MFSSESMLCSHNRSSHGKSRAAGDHATLSGRTVMVVEDEPFVAMHLELVLSDAGAVVMDPANSVSTAMASLAGTEPDVAVLDVNLVDGLVFPLAHELAERGIPFVFVTAHATNDAVFDSAFDNCPRLNKPVDETKLLTTLASIARR